MSWFERTLTANGFPIKKAERDHLRLSGLPANQLVEWINNQRKAIVRHHLENSPFYRKLVEDHLKDNSFGTGLRSSNVRLDKHFSADQNTLSTPEAVEALLSEELELLWSRLPIMTKADLQRPLSERYAIGYNAKNTHKHKTSGSSGHPFVFVKDRYAHAYSWAEIKQLYRQWDIELGVDLEARFYGIPLRGLTRHKEHMKDWLARRQRMVIFDLSDNKLEEMLKRFQKYPFGYLNGYTSSIVRLGQYLTQKSIVLKAICPTLKACIVTSEMLFPEDKIMLEQALGVPVLNEYGASELGVIAMVNSSGALAVNNTSVYLELLDDSGQPVSSGEQGRVILTALHNKAHALIRYDIGDLAHWDKATTPYAPKLAGILGRTNDMAHLPGNKKVPGLTFYYVTKAVISDHSPVSEFVIEQHHLDQFVIRYVSKRPLNTEETLKIRKALEVYVGSGLSVDMVHEAALDRSKRGKLRQFSNLMNDHASVTNEK